jgi:hypothetical protein
VAADELLAANALLGAAASAGQVAGPLVASVALALSGFPAAFIVDAASYLIGAAVIAWLPVRSAAVTVTSASFLVVEPLYARHMLRARRHSSRCSRQPQGPGRSWPGWSSPAYAGAFAWGVAGSVFGAVTLTMLQRTAPVHTHGRVMSLSATVQSWVETIGVPLGGVTVAALGVRPGAFALAGVAIVAGLIAQGVGARAN